MKICLQFADKTGAKRKHPPKIGRMLRTYGKDVGLCHSDDVVVTRQMVEGRRID